MASDSITHFVTLGGESENALYEPRINRDGTIPIGSDEVILTETAEHLVHIVKYERGSKTWDTVVKPQKKALAVITQSRAAFNWRHYKSDPALGSFFERRVAATIMERDEGRKWALACQVQAASVFTVMIGVPKGLMRKASRVRLCFMRDGAVYGVDLVELDPNTADRLAALILRGFAKNRIDTKSDLSPAELEGLKKVTQGRAERKFNGWAHYYDLPASSND